MKHIVLCIVFIFSWDPVFGTAVSCKELLGAVGFNDAFMKKWGRVDTLRRELTKAFGKDIRGYDCDGALNEAFKNWHASGRVLEDAKEHHGLLEAAVPFFNYEEGEALETSIARANKHYEDIIKAHRDFEERLELKEFFKAWSMGGWTEDGRARKELVEEKLKSELTTLMNTFVVNTFVTEVSPSNKRRARFLIDPFPEEIKKVLLDHMAEAESQAQKAHAARAPDRQTQLRELRALAALLSN